MDSTLSLTNAYWDLLKSLSDDVKLRLATRLTASVLEHVEDAELPCTYSVEELRARVRQGLVDARQGKGVTVDELKKESLQW